MTPSIYLSQDTVTAILTKKTNLADPIRGLGYSMDNNSVFHVFNDPPKVSPSGILLECFFQYLNSDDFDIDNIENNYPFNLDTKENKQALIVFVTTTNDNKVKAKGFLYDSKRFIECSRAVTIPSKDQNSVFKVKQRSNRD